MKYPNFREEKKLWRKGCKIIIGLDEAGRGCEKSDAEVLTDNGWKFYFNINQKDKVLSYTDDGHVEWQVIKKITEQDFNGHLVELRNRGIDIIVTPEHYFVVLRRVFRRDKKNGDRLKLIGYKTRNERKRVDELDKNDFIPRGGKWVGDIKNNFVLPVIEKHKEKNINIKLWIAFLGIFLAEGSIYYDRKKGSYRITISQSISSSYKKYKRIERLLKKLPFHFNHLKNGFNCYNKQLFNYLKQFGDKYTKFIPAEFKNLTSDVLNILIKWMLLGDGSCYVGKKRKKVSVYYTASNKLKDDFEEILLKANWTYHTSKRLLRDRYINGRLIKKENQRGCFEIRLRRNNKAHIKSLHKKEIAYKGKVFCLQLPRYHNFFIRRNGTGYFTGNSLSGPVVAAAIVVLNYKKIKIKNIKDSKKLSPKKREQLYDVITAHPNIKWGIGIVSEKIIDKINILEATKLAMQKAVKSLKRKIEKKIKNRLCPKSGDRRILDTMWFLILDGNFRINSKIPQKSIVKGDEKVFSCAAASIIAKVTRDRIMLKYHKKYPQYGFGKHKGYPTSFHRVLLKKYGPCKIHRKTFKPVNNLIK